MSTSTFLQRLDQVLFYPEEFVRQTNRERNHPWNAISLPLILYPVACALEWHIRNRYGASTNSLESGVFLLSGMFSTMIQACLGFVFLFSLLTVFLGFVAKTKPPASSLFFCLAHVYLILTAGSALRSLLIFFTGNSNAYLSLSLFFPKDQEWDSFRQLFSTFDLAYLVFLLVLGLILKEYGKLSRFESFLWLATFFGILQLLLRG